MTAGPLDLAQLRRRAAAANEKAISRMVAIIDGLENRAEADQVLDLVRPRLGRLGLPRPIGFTRLLFVPLEGVIVPTRLWQRGEPQLPRTALPSLGNALRTAMGAEAEALIEEGRRLEMADIVSVGRLGGRLWPRAATLLPARAPEGWIAAGLNESDYRVAAALCAPVLAQGPALHAALRETRDGPPDNLVHAALAPLAAAGKGPLLAGLATLLRQATRPGQVLAVTAALGSEGRGVATPMLDAMLAQPVPGIDRMDLDQAAGTIDLLAQQLDDLGQCSLVGSTQHRRLRALRQLAEDACRQRLRADGDAQVVAPLLALLTEQSIPDSAIDAVEDNARALRCLALGARRLNAGDPPEQALQEITLRVQALAGQSPALTAMDLARILEILAGPDAALPLLRARGQPL